MPAFASAVRRIAAACASRSKTARRRAGESGLSQPPANSPRAQRADPAGAAVDQRTAGDGRHLGDRHGAGRAPRHRHSGRGGDRRGDLESGLHGDRRNPAGDLAFGSPADRRRAARDHPCAAASGLLAGLEHGPDRRFRGLACGAGAESGRGPAGRHRAGAAVSARDCAGRACARALLRAARLQRGHRSHPAGADLRSDWPGAAAAAGQLADLRWLRDALAGRLWLRFGDRGSGWISSADC